MNPEILLSDKFVEFSQNVTVLHESKKKINAELKKLLEEHKINLKKIEDEVAKLTAEFNIWEKEQSKAKTA
jgi:hypothetical protein